MNVLIMARGDGWEKTVRPLIWLVGLLVLGLLLAACGAQPATDEPAQPAEAQLSPLATEAAAAAPTPLPSRTSTPRPQPTPVPTDTPAPTPSAGQLVLLHTNDIWGETEPCG